jgi:alkylation response protein AidB-like acyl-CoA dehydrogenase
VPTVADMSLSVWRARDWLRPDVAARVAGPDPAAALTLAQDLAPVARALEADPWRYLTTLATLGAADLTVARAAEPHLDALAILAQAGDPDLSGIRVDASSTFGVYAAGAPGAGLQVTPAEDGLVTLRGEKPWCSLADRLTHALVTAGAPAAPGLYAMPLRHPGLRSTATPWVPRGLTDVLTAGLVVTDVPAVPVGAPGWYLERPGFAWGGIGVAAVWFGGAAAVAGRLVETARRRPPDQVALVHLGRTDILLHGALLSLRDAADAIAAGRATGPDGVLLGARVRAVVAGAAEEVMGVVRHALGPGPLTADEEHARRVADLTVYLRQHHAERDLAALGTQVLAAVGTTEPAG